MEVMHKNHNKVDCALKNLEMGTSKDNATGNKRVTSIVDGVKNTYASIRDAARETGVAQTTIRRNILRERYGVRLTSKRVKFKLVKDDKEESKESEESEENLEMGTSSDNSNGKIPVTLSIDGVKNTYDSICDAARENGIAPTTIRENIKRKRYDELITSKRVKFRLFDE
jgi:transposase-like protein